MAEAPPKNKPPIMRDGKQGWFSKDGSFVNKLIFPAPEPSYEKTSYPGQLVWIPKRVEDALEFGALREDQVVPCLLLRNYSPNSNFLMIYLHGNAADLGRCRSLCLAMMKLIGCHIIAVEYPGYGIYPGWPNEDTVCETAEQVYNWVVSPYGMAWPPEQIIIMGRSIGSGPAVHLSQQVIKKNAPLPSQFNDEPRPKSGGIFNAISGMFDGAAVCVADHTAPNPVNGPPTHSPRAQAQLEEDNVVYHEFPDPFLSIPNSRFMVENLLTKASISFDPNWSNERLIRLARAHDLVPPLEVCLRSNKNLKCALLVLYAPFESISDVVSSYAGDWASYLVSNRFRNIDKIKNVSCPLLIIHSEKDEIIPIKQGENLVAKAREHHVNVRFHKIKDLLHNETNVSRDISKPVRKMLKTSGGEYVRWDPPDMVFHPPVSLKTDLSELRET